VVRKNKAERHHWWPMCVSKHWTTDDGTVGFLKPDGSYIRTKPEKIGVIRNGHQIILGASLDEPTKWDINFEDEYARVDSNFPAIISWLRAVAHLRPHDEVGSAGFCVRDVETEPLRSLTESIVSLIVRSPMYRQLLVASADAVNTHLSPKERETLIAANLRGELKRNVDRIGVAGKYVVFEAAESEFAYGDGFFNNFEPILGQAVGCELFVPVTPNLAVLIVCPMYYLQAPRLMVRTLNGHEVNECNYATQIYARNSIYFRSQAPFITSEFACAEHRRFTNSNHFLGRVIRSIPGILTY
jgi:hypothetical protein